MKKKIAYVVLTATIGMVAFFGGMKMSVPEVAAEINTEENDVYNSDYLDMTQVIDFEIDNDSLYLYTSSGDVYLWER